MPLTDVDIINPIRDCVMFLSGGISLKPMADEPLQYILFFNILIGYDLFTNIADSL